MASLEVKCSLISSLIKLLWSEEKRVEWGQGLFTQTIWWIGSVGVWLGKPGTLFSVRSEPVSYIDVDPLHKKWCFLVKLSCLPHLNPSCALPRPSIRTSVYQPVASAAWHWQCASDGRESSPPLLSNLPTDCCSLLPVHWQGCLQQLSDDLAAIKTLM